MRRLLASLLVALFSFSLIAPAVFASDPESKLPACCRRDGKHHCGMASNAAEPGSGPAVRAARCPSFPAAKAVPAHQTSGAPGVSRSLLAVTLLHAASAAQPDSRSLISYSQSGQERGPPSFFS